MGIEESVLEGVQTEEEREERKEGGKNLTSMGMLGREEK